MTYVHNCEPCSRQRKNENQLHFCFVNSLRAIPTSGQELEKLRRDLDLNQVKMGKLLGVSREWVSRLEGGGAPISDFMRMKLTALVNSTATSDVNLDDLETPDLVVGSQEFSAKFSPKAPAPLRRITTPMQIAAGFPPRPPEPTPQACIDHFLTYLKAAEHAPGGIGFAWRTLQKHFPLDEFDPAKK
jgi:transcriptional regulator with XRE-family HTH domain